MKSQFFGTLRELCKSTFFNKILSSVSPPTSDYLDATRLLRAIWPINTTSNITTLETVSSSLRLKIQYKPSQHISPRTILLLSSHQCLHLPNAIFSRDIPTKEKLCVSCWSMRAILPPSWKSIYYYHHTIRELIMEDGHVIYNSMYTILTDTIHFAITVI